MDDEAIRRGKIRRRRGGGRRGGGLRQRGSTWEIETATKTPPFPWELVSAAPPYDSDLEITFTFGG